MRAAQNWAQSLFPRRGYPRTKNSEFGGPCREISSSGTALRWLFFGKVVGVEYSLVNCRLIF